MFGKGLGHIESHRVVLEWCAQYRQSESVVMVHGFNAGLWLEIELCFSVASVCQCFCLFAVVFVVVHREPGR
jgi:alpha/beta superfamily hydrolase